MKRRENTLVSVKPSEEKISKHEDVALKATAEFFINEIMPALEIKGKVVASLATEGIALNLKKGFQDFNFLMEDETIKHFEFQSTNEGLIGLKRFRMYEAIISYQNQRVVTTYVLFSGNIKRPMIEFSEGINTYKVVPIILSDKDADEIIIRLCEKVDAGEPVNKADLLPLCLSPLMGGKMTQKERIMAAYDITRRATGVGVDVIQKVEAVIYIMADKFLESKEMISLKEEIKMTRLGQMLFYDGVAEGEVRGREEGRAEGERSLLILQVQRKLDKGKTLEVIADEVEKDVETIAVILEEINETNGDK